MDEAQETGRRRRRRRRQRGEAGELFGRGFGPLLPHLLTTGNLAAGFYAIVKAPDNVWYASWAILVAAIFDMLDGRAARLTKSESRFGVEYDSIADTVSFCVAPAVIAFHAGAFLGPGLCGALTTFSTFQLELVRLTRDGEVLVGAAYLVVTLAAGLAAARTGFRLAHGARPGGRGA